MSRTHRLDPRLTDLLRDLRSRVRRYIVWDALLALTAVVLGGFWIGLVVDFVPVKFGGSEMPRSARALLLVGIGVLALWIVARLLIGRLLRRLPDDSLALLVERHHPDFGGRLVTAVQLSRPDREGDAYAPGLLEVVHRQAAAMANRVDPRRIFRRQPLVRKGLLVGPLALASVVLAATRPDTFVQAAGRLSLWSDDPWPRRAELQMVGVELPTVSAAEDAESRTELIPFEDRIIRLPRGSNGTLRIRARADGAVVPDVCTLYYWGDDGTRGQANLRRVGRVVDGFQSFLLDSSPLAGLTESLTLQIRGLDARLDGYRIEAVPPPVISGLRVEMRYPQYLRPPDATGADVATDYRAGIRVREGSEVTLVATSDRPLGELDLEIRDDLGVREPGRVEFSEDRRQARLRFDQVTSATRVRMIPRDDTGISAQSPYRYFLGIVSDEPPSVTTRLQGIGSAITPIARLPVVARVEDDYGVESLRIVIAAAANDGEGEAGEPPLASDGDTVGGPGGAGGQTSDRGPEAPDSTMAVATPRPDREGRAETVLDLRDLAADGEFAELAPGQTVRLFGEAEDAYDLADRAPSRSEVFRLQVVTPEQLLALLERRELAYRSRLEQTIDETRGLRDTLDSLRTRWAAQAAAADTSGADDLEASPPGGADAVEATDRSEGEPDDSPDGGQSAGEETARRELQVRRLRIQQASLQADKTSEELVGIVASLGDLLEEMVNNRVDSVDRRQRIGDGVRDPLRQVIDQPLARLRETLATVTTGLDRPQDVSRGMAQAVSLADQVLLDLTAVLDKMLDLESYNEILDLFRGLIDDQERLLEETKQRQKRSVLDLFD